MIVVINVKLCKMNQEKDNSYIKVINGRWHLNNKTFNEMTLKEKQRVDEHIKFGCYGI